jgi:hypothetical protein
VIWRWFYLLNFIGNFDFQLFVHNIKLYNHWEYSSYLLELMLSVKKGVLAVLGRDDFFLQL